MAADGRTNVQLAKVLKHPLRQRLLFEYSSVTSPSKAAGALGERVNVVSYHTDVLRRAGCIELVRTEPRRGASEHFYRTTVTTEIEDADWEQLPEELRRALTRRTLEAGWREATTALVRGGMDDRLSHVSRLFLDLDAQGRAQLAALLRSTFDAALGLERASRGRGGEDSIPCQLLVMSFKRASRP